MSQVLEKTLTKSADNWQSEETYRRIKEEAIRTWPDWKKVAYNEMFAFSAHATKFTVNESRNN